MFNLGIIFVRFLGDAHGNFGRCANYVGLALRWDIGVMASPHFLVVSVINDSRTGVRRIVGVRNARETVHLDFF